MALEVPMRSSTGGFVPVFPADMLSTSSPEPQIRRPASVQRVPAHYSLINPSDLVGPSPVTSTGTASTEIEDEEAEDSPHSLSQVTEPPQLAMLQTNIAENIQKSTNEESLSVIHAPQSFLEWTDRDNGPQSETEIEAEESERDHDADVSVTSEDRPIVPTHIPYVGPTPPPLSTNVKPVRYSVDDGTPRAQDPRDFSETSRGRPGSTSSLEKIEEVDDGEDGIDHDKALGFGFGESSSIEVEHLKTALHECWTFCNTLANFSSFSRAQTFKRAGTPDAHEKAWRCCWKLCQMLYNKKEEVIETSRVRTTLGLCRDFCQSLFEIRVRPDDNADSVLRVSFELNNHLFSGQDFRTLPEPFRERTLDFYLTLCHRLMKQRAELNLEADSLLRACWSLAEMLFSLRMSRYRQHTDSDEVELLTSAVQACWDLCDMFREGWPLVRPDRNTPRPNQTSFFAPQPERVEHSTIERSESRTSNRSKMSKHSVRSERMLPAPPETPVTEFDDAPLSPDSDSPLTASNILVLGASASHKERKTNGMWSTTSNYSQNTTKTSSTATTATQNEDANITKIKILVLKLAIILGFERDSASDGKAGMASLQHWVKSLGDSGFGALPSKKTLFQQYKRLVLGEYALPRTGTLPPKGKRATASELAQSVGMMIMRGPQYQFLREIYWEVFEFYPEKAESKTDVSTVIYV